MIQLREQVVIQVEIQVAIQVQIRVRTQVSTRLRIRLLVLPTELLRVLRGELRKDGLAGESAAARPEGSGF